MRNARQPFQRGFILGAPLVNLAIATRGRLPPGRLAWHRDDERPVFVGSTARRYPKPDGRYTFDKLSSVYISATRPATTRPTTSACAPNVPRELAETWRWMCPAGVYEIPEDAPRRGNVDVIVNYTNCVQCGAITAKGGRLTTPEGGDGPHYQQMCSKAQPLRRYGVHLVAMSSIAACLRRSSLAASDTLAIVAPGALGAQATATARPTRAARAAYDRPDRRRRPRGDPHRLSHRSAAGQPLRDLRVPDDVGTGTARWRSASCSRSARAGSPSCRSALRDSACGSLAPGVGIYTYDHEVTACPPRRHSACRSARAGSIATTT